MNMTRRYYPAEGKEPYYIEFSQWPGRDLQWTLFQRNYICSLEEWNKEEHDLLESREVHPWNLGDGTVNINNNAIRMNTESFLRFMVDALNKKGGKI